MQPPPPAPVSLAPLAPAPTAAAQAASSAGVLTVSMTGLSQDLDLIVLDGNTCDVGECLEASLNGESNSESVSLSVSAGDVVTVVVDGWSGAVSDYTLSVQCGGGGDDDDDDDDDDAVLDDDGDGFPAGIDCDDSDPAINPAATESCDTVDNDCSGAVDDNGACPGCTFGAYGGHTYQACWGFAADWGDAATACSTFGYYLTTVDDGAENTFLSSIAAVVAPGGQGGWWIGYTDQGGWQQEGNWTWVGPASSTGYENWNSGEPNNAGNEDCAEMTPWTGWGWNDRSCGTANGFLCEGDF